MAACQLKSKAPGNELHLAALASLKGEIIELNSRFQQLTHERDSLEKQLNKSQLEKLRFARESDGRLEQQALQYEGRLTELHSVIAELSKKIESQKATVIREEDESSRRSNDSCSQAMSNDNNPNESFTDNEDLCGDLCQVVGDRPPLLGTRKLLVMADKEVSTFTPSVDCDSMDGRPFQVCKELEDVSLSSSEHPTSTMQLAQLHLLQSEKSALQEQLGRQETELNKVRNTLSNMREERDRLRKKIRELQSKLQGVHSQSSLGSQTGSPTHSKAVYVNSTTGERTPTSREEAPITKIAERIKLKKMESGDRQILGSEISIFGVSNTKVVEHLVRPLQDESNAQEIFQTLYSTGSQVSEHCIREFEVETERLNSRIEHLKAQNDLLTLTLDESKAQCDRLSLLIGQYESNCTAFQLALCNSDQAIEAYEAVGTLLETEMGLLLANCRAAGLGVALKNNSNDNHEEVAAMLKKAQDMRKGSENVAKHLLQRLDRNNGLLFGSVGSGSPWDDNTAHVTSGTSSTSSGCEADFNKCDEQRLRDHITQLKNNRNTVRGSVMELEPIHVDPLAKEPSSTADAQKFDLENAVLMQELTAIKEEKTDLKAQVYLLERELAALELRLSSREAQDQAYLAQIEHLKVEMKEQQLSHNKLIKNDHLDGSQQSDGSELPQELIDALQREKKLKLRVQDLVSTLEKVTKNSELRHQQSAEFVNDLKRANSALVAAFEKSKRKYQSKIKKLEQQIMLMVDKHSSQVRMLKQRISFFEEEQTCGIQLATSETSL